MIKLRHFGHFSETQMAKTVLLSHGIEAQAVGAKLMVKEEDFNHASKILALLDKDKMFTQGKGEVDHFKKALMYGIGAPFIVPVVFNFISLKHAYKYWQESDQDTEAQIKVGLIIALQFFTIVAIQYMIHMFSDFSSMMPKAEDLDI